MTDNNNVPEKYSLWILIYKFCFDATQFSYKRREEKVRETKSRPQELIATKSLSYLLDLLDLLITLDVMV
jgi:hypothetical protein